SQPFAPQ
ncbi:hypothetical protein D030_3207B, partial [Vibrio parahaemolyticus AQ3810]